MKRHNRKKLPQPAALPDVYANLETFKPYLSDGEYAALQEEVTQSLPPAIRINPLKASGALPAFLHGKYGWTLESIPFCAAGYRVTRGEGPEPGNTLEHKLGHYYIQEAASMLPVELFSIQPGKADLCLDLAASPGGKTTHLVSRLEDCGLVLANDSSQGRIPALRIVLQNWGATNAAITRFPGESYGSWYPDTFDRVLLDAPCSMQGLRTAESHPVRPVTDAESSQLARRQAALLASALQAVRVGGEVVYSTCTLLPAEDEGVVAATLERFAGQVQLLDAQSRLPIPAPGITSPDGITIDPRLEQTIRLWPHRYHTAGFFACLLQKTGETSLPELPPPTHSMEKAGFFEMNARESQTFCANFQDTYGYDLGAYLVEAQRVLVQRAEKFFLFPALLLEQFPTLPVQSAGLLLGERLPDGFLPSQEWVTRFGSSCRQNILPLDATASNKLLSGEPVIEGVDLPRSAAKYQVVLNQENYPLGCVKVTGRGLKNLLPRRLL
ncbi:MAG TPA: hypothetical protein PK040_02775 [Anaerolineaceae bacterium]|nr:hypothetical protein [Anaerolineaceae bacterium]